MKGRDLDGYLFFSLKSHFNLDANVTFLFNIYQNQEWVIKAFIVHLVAGFSFDGNSASSLRYGSGPD